VTNATTAQHQQKFGCSNRFRYCTAANARSSAAGQSGLARAKNNAGARSRRRIEQLLAPRQFTLALRILNAPFALGQSSTFGRAELVPKKACG